MSYKLCTITGSLGGGGGGGLESDTFLYFSTILYVYLRNSEDGKLTFWEWMGGGGVTVL